jgi:hypothetical protein
VDCRFAVFTAALSIWRRAECAYLRDTSRERERSRLARAQAPVENPVEARRRADFAAMQTFRPGYAFWRHVFTLPSCLTLF